MIEEVLAFPHKQAPEDTQRTLDAFVDHDTSDRLAQIAARTLVTAHRPHMLHGVSAEPAVAAESLTVVRGDKEVLHSLSFTVPRSGRRKRPPWAVASGATRTDPRSRATRVVPRHPQTAEEPPW